MFTKAVTAILCPVLGMCDNARSLVAVCNLFP